MSWADNHTGVRLRAATAADAPAVADLYLRSRRELLPDVPLAHPDDDVRRWVASVLLPAGGTTVAAGLRGGVVGFVSVAVDGDDPGLGWVEQLYLEPGALRRGIGRQLLAAGLAALPPRVRLYCFQSNTRALAFYAAMGFREVARGDGSGNEEGCPDVLLERQP